MSKFCGKCDFYDSMCIGCGHDDNEIEEWLANTEVFIGCPFSSSDPVRLEVKNEYDAAPLYPHIVGVSIGNNGKNRMYLASKPFYDEQDDERLDMLVADIEKAIRSLKRKNIPVTEDAIKEKIWYHENDDDIHEIIQAILGGYKPKPPQGRMGSYHREVHYNELIRLGYSDSAAYLITHYNKTRG